MWQCTLWIALVLGCAGCAADNDKTPARCGNDILDADELCDGALIDSNFVCNDGQRPTGCNHCVPDCPTASACGNATIDEGEACDGANVPACPSGTVGEVTCSATCEADTSRCVPMGGTVMVHVLEGTMDRPNTYVVSHDPDGTPITECMTDTAGLCAFAGVPANAMITIAYVRDAIFTEFATTFTHVTAPQTIEFVIPPPGTAFMPIGTALVTVPGPYPGATTSVTMNGCTERQHGDFTTVHQHSFNETCVDANEEGGMYGEARDASANALAWSYLRKPIPGDTTFALPAWSPSFSTLTTQITNVPSTMSTLRLECNALLDSLVPLMRRRDVTPPAATETLAATMPSSLATFARCAVHLGLSAQSGSQFCEQRQLPPFTTFSFDGSDLLPPLTSTFTENPFDLDARWTCTLASQPTPSGDVSQCFKGFYRGGAPTTHIAWYLIAPGDFLGTLTAPGLGPSSPISLSNASALPGAHHARRWAYSDVSSYSDYLDGRVEPVAGEACAVFHAPL